MFLKQRYIRGFATVRCQQSMYLGVLMRKEKPTSYQFVR